MIALLGLVLVLAVAFVAFLLATNSPAPPDPELRHRLDSKRGQVRQMRQDVEKRKIALEDERRQVRGAASFAMLRQLHHESHQAGNAWYQSLKSAQRTRDDFRREISELKASRRYHAQQRSSTRGRQRGYHGRAGSHTTQAIDGLYCALEDLGTEIRLMREQLTAFNVQTAELRDYIGENCGTQGRKWRQSLQARSQTRKSLPKGRSHK